MKRLALFLLAASLQAATFYVANPGNNANAGTSLGAPWADLQYAVNHAACGDIINIVANGAYVPGDATLPYMAGCSLVTTIQSSALAQFAPPGYRTNPANDAAAYGKLQLTSGPVTTGTIENHGSSAASYGMCGISSIASNTITLSGSWCNGHMFNLANGSQVEFEINNTSNLTATIPPTPLTIFTHYFVVNCSGGCGNSGSTFQVAATSGGSPITLTACSADCLAGTGVTHPLEFTSGSATITTPDTFTTIANGTPVTLSSAGMQALGTLPTPFNLDTFYYVVNLSGRTFGLSATLGGSAITATSIGFGPLNLATALVPRLWAFRGLEIKPTTSNPGLPSLLQFGDGNNTSVIATPDHFEVDRCWLHDNPADADNITRGITNNGAYIYIHDTYIAGVRNARGEAQAIQSSGSPGPSAYVNNLLEASTQAVLNGGNGNAAGIANARQDLIGNYLYRPPIWKVTTGTGPASGPCFYDATDPNHAGGEWYRDTMAGQNYQCQPNGTWGTTGAALPLIPLVKTAYEHKSGQYIRLIANLVNYVWADGQKGQGFTWHQSEDSSAGRANDHITAMHNKLTNLWRFMTGQSHCNNGTVFCSTIPSQHTAINNLSATSLYACGVGGNTGFGAGTCGQYTAMTNWDGFPTVGSFWNHNTFLTADSINLGTYAFVASIDNGSTCPPGNTNFGLLDYWVHKNSIVPYDFQGTCNNGGATFAAYFLHAFFDKNALVYHNGAINYSSPGATNTFSNFDTSSATNAAVGYVNLAAGDYHLASSSNYSAQNLTPLLISDDGTDLGADIDLVNMMTSGVAAGTPPWDSSLQISPGSTKAVARFTAPTSGVYTWTIYSSPARIAANVVGSPVADSAVAAIKDGTYTEIPYSGLTAATHYWYKLVNGSVIMVGDFWTKAAGSGAYPFSEAFSAATAMIACDDKPLTVNCTSYSAALSQSIPVNTNTIRYVAPTAVQSAVRMRVAP